VPDWKRLEERLHRVEDILLALLLTAMIGLAALQILLRNLFNVGLPWADPTLRLLVLWVALAGAMVATRLDKHIRVDVISRWLRPDLRRTASRLSDLFASLVCGSLAWQAARFVWYEHESGLRLFGTLPAWVAELILPLGFAVMAVRFLARAATPQPPARG